MSEPSESIPVARRHRPRWPFVVAGIVGLLLVVVVGAWLWLRHGWAVYGQAHAAYLQGDCRTALPQYARLQSYPRLAGPFVDMLHREEAQCRAFEEASALGAAGDRAGAISGWEQLRSNWPDSTLAPLALEAIAHEYGAWAGEQRQAGDFQAALATSDQLAARFPDLQAQADADVQTTYLAWGDKLRAAGDYDQAAQVADALAGRGEPFVQAARLAWGQVMLDWGAALAGEGAYAEAEGKYRALLQREHDWLAPLADASGEAAGLVSYGQVWMAANAPDRPLRGGPGDRYATLEVVVKPGEGGLDVVGASAEPGWYAVRLAEGVSSTLGWLPADQSGQMIAGGLGIPLSGRLVAVLAADSDAAARAAEGLRALYPVWAATVDPAEAAPLYATLAELAPDEAARQAAWEQALEAALEAARLVAARGDWEAAIGDYEALLALEFETYSIGQATVAKDGALLMEAPRVLSVPVFSAPLGTQWPVLGRSGEEGIPWILLLLPAAPEAQVWIAAEEATLSVPLETLPDRESAPLTGLYSHRALLGWLHAKLGWAGELAANRDWEAALSLYQIAADAAVPGSAEATSGLQGVLTTRLGWAAELEAGREWEAALDQYQAVTEAALPDSAELASGLDGLIRTRLAWAAALSAGQKWLEAVEQYKVVVELAPDGSQPAADAAAGLAALAAEGETLAADEPCAAVLLLDALAGTASAARAAEALPVALLQCAQMLVETDRLAQAEAKYLRVLAEFPKSKQAAAARRGVQRVAWMNSIDDLGLYDAADAVCEKAGKNVQAKVSTLDKPWVAYNVAADGSWWDPLPSALTGEERQTTVVVCVGEEQETQVEVCPGLMVTGPDSGKEYDLIRIRYYRPVRLVDPVAGLTVAAGTLSGSQPEVCHATETFTYYLFSGRFYHYGDHPDNEDLVTWIERNLKP